MTHNQGRYSVTVKMGNQLVQMQNAIVIKRKNKHMIEKYINLDCGFMHEKAYFKII